MFLKLFPSLNVSTLLVQLRAFGRRTRGVISMRLKEGDKMAAMDIIPAAVQKDLQKLTESSGNR